MANAKLRKESKLYHYLLVGVIYVAKVTAIRPKTTYWHNSFRLILM